MVLPQPPSATPRTATRETPASMLRRMERRAAPVRASGGGVGLVENADERLLVERTREGDPLALPSGQGGSVLADLGLVALRQVQDHLVNRAGLGGGDDRIVVGLGFEAADVLGHGPGEKL